jgi:general secretion pathway protein D
VASAILAGLGAAGAAAQEPEQANPQQNVRRMVTRPIPRRSPAAAVAEQQAARRAREDQAQNNSVEETINGNTFNFKDAELYEIIEAVSALTGRNFQIDATVKGKITLITNTPIPPELAYEVLESILQAQGFALVPSVDGNIIRVIQMRKAISSDIPTGTGPDTELIDGYERFQTQLVPIMYGDASEISQVVNSLISQDAGNVNVYAPTNTIIITTTVANLRRLLDIIRQIDVPGFEQKIEIVTLEYARAADLASEIQEVFGEQGTAGRSTTRAVPSVRQVRSTSTATARTRTAASIIGTEPTMRIVSDERTNSLILVATQGMLDEIMSLIKKLDTSTSFEEENLHVYPLLNADAKEVATILGELTSGVQPRRGGQAGGAQQQAQIQPFEREVNIVAYEVTNVLLIMASPEDYVVIKAIIDKLDVLQNQVWVEAILLKVEITDEFQVAVDMSALFEEDVVAGSAFGAYADLANALTGGPTALPTGGVVGIIDNDHGATMTIPSGVEGVPPTVINIPYIPAVITAMQTVTDLDVLSTPQLLIADNVQGSIVVGKEVPFITGSTRGLNQSVGAAGFGGSVFSQIRRQDVGITLNVTPQISEGEYVKLELQITNSDVIVPPSGATDVNIAGPTLSKSEITNQIVIQNGHTAVLGGLISSGESSTRSKVPFLGDIPLLGYLFRGSTKSNIKSNLVAFITPTIVKTGEQMAELSEARRTTFDGTKVDVLTSDNYLKRVFKKVKQPKE